MIPCLEDSTRDLLNDLSPLLQMRSSSAAHDGEELTVCLSCMATAKKRSASPRVATAAHKSHPLTVLPGNLLATGTGTAPLAASSWQGRCTGTDGRRGTEGAACCSPGPAQAPPARPSTRQHRSFPPAPQSHFAVLGGWMVPTQSEETPPFRFCMFYF